MKKNIWIVLVISASLAIPSLQAQEIKTFQFENIGGSVTVTQDIPSYYFGDYESMFPKLQPGEMSLSKEKNFVSKHWWDKSSNSKKFTWGVLVKNGKIDKQNITPPNKAYRPYDRMKLIIRYEDENMGLVTWGLYRATSEKFGTRIVAGQYIRKKGK
ncbi:MAG: hypothetical protein ACC641_01845 [Acidiferrobacterales bacterium]